MTHTPCEHCEGHLVVYATRRKDGGRRIVRYHHCWLCGKRPKDNKTSETVQQPEIGNARLARKSRKEVCSKT